MEKKISPLLLLKLVNVAFIMGHVGFFFVLKIYKITHPAMALWC
jgi:hypothetical protein